MTAPRQPVLVAAFPGNLDLRREWLRIDGRCTACGLCLATCPERALTRAPQRPAVDHDRCTLCMACIEVCPVDAITVVSSR